MVGMSVYLIIPARGGSKGIPAKNLRPVGGVPLVVRAVRAALASSADRVFVSTDDPAIAAAAGEAGAELINRPAALSGDDSTSESAILHALDVLAARGDPEPAITVMVQCTSPLTGAAEIDGTLAVLTADDADCAFTGARSHAFLWRLTPEGALAVNHDPSLRPRRQDQAPEYADTGAVYAMRTEGFRRSGHRFFGRIAVHPVPPEHALEIDSATDLLLAETLVRESESEERRQALPEKVAGLALDFDGVLTDNRVMTFQDGAEAVTCDRSDGLGIGMLLKAGVPMVVLSKEANPVVSARCRKLGLECIQGLDDKRSAFVRWMEEHELDPAGVVFVGNDVNDLECLRLAGCGVVVHDAYPEALAEADLVLRRPGGQGAVRELADLILADTKEV